MRKNEGIDQGHPELKVMPELRTRTPSSLKATAPFGPLFGSESTNSSSRMADRSQWAMLACTSLGRAAECGLEKEPEGGSVRMGE